MSVAEFTYPTCNSNHTVKNGTIHNRKFKGKCQSCGRQFVINSAPKMVDERTRKIIDKLLLEKISLAGIARATDASEKWLQDYVNRKYAEISRQVKVTKKTRKAVYSM